MERPPEVTERWVAVVVHWQKIVAFFLFVGVIVAIVSAALQWERKSIIEERIDTMSTRITALDQRIKVLENGRSDQQQRNAGQDAFNDEFLKFIEEQSKKHG